MTHFSFVQRCREAMRRAESWVPSPRSQPERRALRYLGSRIARLERDARIPATLVELEERWQAFCELRDVLRLAQSELPGGDVRREQLTLPALEKVRLLRIERAVRQYTQELRKKLDGMTRREAEDTPNAVILKYLDEYDGHLFGHPVLLDDDGNIIVVVLRTNNPPEHLFGRGKQELRRRVGRANLGRDMQQQPAQIVYAYNLRDTAYVRIVCGSLENLPAVFAALDADTIQEGTLVRDHRDSGLVRRIHALLENDEQGGSAAGVEVVYQN